jgi:hypothetical protein
MLADKVKDRACEGDRTGLGSLIWGRFLRRIPQVIVRHQHLSLACWRYKERAPGHISTG